MAVDDLEGMLARLGALIASSPHNLVSRAERAQVRAVHIAEAEAVADVIGPLPERSAWVDLGTGGGLPGLVLAALHPTTRWALVDSVQKKIHAVQDFAQQLGLENVEAVLGRAELLAHLPAHRQQYDGVVARAVAPLPVLAELARGFVLPGGRLFAIKGPRWEEELEQAQRALQLLRWDAEGAVAVDAAVRPTWLVTLRAVGRAPAAYPRDVGVPRRQPLGGPAL